MSKSEVKVSDAKAIKGAMSLAELDSRFNPNVIIPNRIQAALDQLGENAMENKDFKVLSGLGDKQLSDYAERFSDYTIEQRLNGRQTRIWCGTKAFAKSARERLLK